MKRKFLVSSLALLTSLLAVGCSNSAGQSSGVTPTKVHKSSQKSSSKTSSTASSTSSESSSQDNSSAAVASSKDSSTSTSVSSQSSRVTTSTSSSSESNSSSAISSSDNLSESDFQTVVNDTIKRNGYPAKTTIQDFKVMQSGSQIDVAEKKTGTIIAHYTVKNGHLYYYDVVSDQQVQVK